jgi:uncharacterized protein YegL
MKLALVGLLLPLVLLTTVPAWSQEAPRIDVVFLIDATGSMGDEIDAVKAKIQKMISEIAVGVPAPDVRFGLVAYRDRGDEYVTSVYELTRDIDKIVDNLGQIRAEGGGDYPESLNEALHTAVNVVNWDPDPAVSRLVFLIADAPPHLDYPDDFDYREEYQMAKERGIAVHAIGASGLDEEGERVFKEIAQGTGGVFQWLTYESRYVDQDGKDVIVVVEGRTATYTKGDSTWTVEGGGGIYAGGGKGGEMVDAADGTGGGGAPAGDVETSTNLDDLITSAIKDAAEARGVDYDGDGTAAAPATWGEVKKAVR